MVVVYFFEKYIQNSAYRCVISKSFPHKESFLLFYGRISGIMTAITSIIYSKFTYTMDLPTTHYDRPGTAPEVKAAAAQPEVKAGGESRLTKAALYLFLISVFLAPLIFIPSLYAPIEVVKMVLLSTTILVAALLYAIDSFRKKTFTVPRNALGYVSIALILSVIVSSFAGGNFLKSFMGQGFEVGTGSFLLLMFLAAYLASRLVIKDRDSVFKIYSAIFISFVVLALFHIARLLGGADFLSFGVLQAVTSTLIGRWYDFAILTAVIGILSLLGIKFLSLRGGLKRLLVVALILSGAFLFIINSAFIWGVVAILAAVIGIYEYAIATPKAQGNRGVFSRVSILSLVIVVLAVVCAWKGNVIAAPLVKSLKAEYGELVLPWQLTLDITAGTLKEAPLFGAGPNRFISQYLRFKPLEINQSPFWNSEFTNSFGFLPTSVVTQGAVGAILWILFLILFVREGVRALSRTTDPLKRFFFASSFFSALFLWIINIVYVPSHAIIFLTFVLSGIFVALLVSEGIIAEKKIQLGGSGRLGRLAPLVSSVAIILLVVWLGAYVKKSVAIAYFQKGIKELNVSKSSDAAQAKFMKALAWSPSDVYYQALSEINILKINALSQEIQAEMTKNQSSTPDQAKIDKIIALITEAVKYTQEAEKIDPNNHYNYLAEARISEIGASLKIPNAYENAMNAYGKAVTVNPFNPGIFLSVARLEASQGKPTEAQQNIGRALQLKSNYIDAIYLLSQIQVASGQLDEALVSTQVALSLTPGEPLLHFQLGLLLYNAKNYTESIKAFEKAVELNKEYANARYFLGLSYARMGRNADAIAQFEELAKTNPENQEVAFILDNLVNGKSPFADAQPPITNTPEKRSTPPVEEKTETTSKKIVPASAKASPSPAASVSPSPTTAPAAKKSN